MNKLLFLFLALTTIFNSSCKKDDLDTCIDVNYNEFFTIEPNHKYCFSDDNFIKVIEFGNAFCPCDVECIWEGEMIFFYEVQIDDVVYKGQTGSSSKTDSTIESKLQLEYKDMNPDKKCGVEIKSVKIKVTKL